MRLVILVGASGSGKTTIAQAIAARADLAVRVFCFDSIGIPSADEMIRRYGSAEAWQRATTLGWMHRLAADARSHPRLLFEGQTRFSLLAEGAAEAGGLAYMPVLVDCDDDTRAQRLRLDRNQPELAGKDMMNWARHLRREAHDKGHAIIDTSNLSLPDSIDCVMTYFET